MSPPRRLWFWMWMVWLAVFIALEAWAIIGCGTDCTLSASVWFLQRSWWPLTIILAVLFIFLIWHFILDRRSRRERIDEKERNWVDGETLTAADLNQKIRDNLDP